MPECCAGLESARRVNRRLLPLLLLLLPLQQLLLPLLLLLLLLLLLRLWLLTLPRRGGVAAWARPPSAGAATSPAAVSGAADAKVRGTSG